VRVLHIVEYGLPIRALNREGGQQPVDTVQSIRKPSQFSAFFIINSMSKQRVVKDSFWSDPYVEDLDPSEKLLFLYLLTNPLCNVAGIFEIKNKRIAYETGFEKDMVDKILNRFKRDKKIIRHKDWIILINCAKNQSTNPNIKKGMQRIIDELPDEVKALKGFERLPHFTLLNLTLPNSTLPNGKTEDVKKPLEEKNINLVSSIIKEMESVNPAVKKMYGNTTQRKACENLLENYSLEEIKEMISFLPQTNCTPYFPRITTPLQLFDKWTQLKSAMYAKKNELQDKKVDVIR